MKLMKRNIKRGLGFIIILFLLLGFYLCYALVFYGDRWFANSYNSRVRMDGWQPKIIPGDILDRNGKILATTKETKERNPKTGEMQTYYYRSYCSESEKARSIAHVVGFHDPQLGRSGVEAFYIKYLMGYNNSLLERIYQKALLPQERGNDVVLTIDFELQQFIDEIMGKHKGAAVVLKVHTGEILAMVSHPTYNPNSLSGEMEGDKLYNRATNGLYPPGSVFKIITAVSALENLEGIMEEEFICEGKLDLSGEVIPCYNEQKHGNINLSKAMIYSCNTVFAQLGASLGRKNLIKTAESFGFNQDFLFKDIKLVASKLPLKSSVSDGKLGWTAVGQGDVLVTPMHMAMIGAAIANDGTMMEPKLLKQVIGRNDKLIKDFEPRPFKKVTSPENAKIIQNMLKDAVEEGTGKNAKIAGVNIAGKTGTAEKQGENGEWKNNAWFVGFAPVDKPSLSIAIVLEDLPEGQTGGSAAAPLAAKILKKAMELGH